MLSAFESATALSVRIAITCWLKETLIERLFPKKKNRCPTFHCGELLTASSTPELYRYCNVTRYSREIVVLGSGRFHTRVTQPYYMEDERRIKNGQNLQKTR